MAGRPRKFDIDTAYNSALQLFWAQGYEATSLDQLVSTMGLSKSSFYQTFESKNSLFQNCLLHYGELLVTDATKGLMETSSPIEFIHNALIQNAKEARNPNEKKGCFIMNTIVEFAQRDPKISKIVTAHLTAMKKVFTQAISSAQAHGDISTQASPIELADYLITTIIGLKTLVKSGASGNKIKKIAHITISSLKNIA